MSALGWDKWTVTSHGRRIPAARVQVSFHVTRGDLVQAAIIALDDALKAYHPGYVELTRAGAALSQRGVEAALRTQLTSYGVMFLEFGSDNKIYAAADEFAAYKTIAEFAITRLYPDVLPEDRY